MNVESIRKGSAYEKLQNTLKKLRDNEELALEECKTHLDDVRTRREIALKKVSKAEQDLESECSLGLGCVENMRRTVADSQCKLEESKFEEDRPEQEEVKKRGMFCVFDAF